MKKKQHIFFRKKNALAIFLLLFVTGLHGIAQLSPTPTYIIGMNAFRSKGYGVMNHNYRLAVLVPSPYASYGPYWVSPTPGNLGAYETTLPLSYTANNTIMVGISSANNYDDYVNGVDGADMLHIRRHILGIALLDNMPSTADAPYRKISADANNDWAITTADVTMIQQLILGIREDLTRKSWEWVRDYAVRIQNPADFKANPYKYPISYDWPGAEGIIMGGLSGNEIANYTWKYYNYRATKVGDISSADASTANTWVTGLGTYRAGTPLVSTKGLQAGQLAAGNSLQLNVQVSASQPLAGLELPFNIDPEDFEVEQVSFAKGFSADWHFAKHSRRLTFLAIDENSKAMPVSSGQLISVRLKAKRNINYLSEAVQFAKGRQVLLINQDAELVKGAVTLSTSPITDGENSLTATVSSGVNNLLTINAPAAQSAIVQVINLNGQPVWRKTLQLNAGNNTVQLPSTLQSGSYVVKVQTTQGGQLTLKYVR
jgi:hypothetical protein